MCMDLMKEEVRANFLWLGQRLGVTGSGPKKKIFWSVAVTKYVNFCKLMVTGTE